jgi:tetratricopeptide (TPR) repeat protein
MSRSWRSALERAAVLAAAAANAACTSLAVAPSRPSPAPAPAPAVGAPLPEPATAPQPAPAPPPSLSRPAPAPARDVAAPRPQSDATAASGALLEQSRVQRAAGSLPVARATLERALRLDPNNAEVWLELGELELQTGNASQAAVMARKALTLTGRDVRLAARAERLLRAAE